MMSILTSHLRATFDAAVKECRKQLTVVYVESQDENSPLTTCASFGRVS